MGNAMAACCLASEVSFVKVIYWDGNIRTLTGKRWIAGEIMIEHPDSMVCDADFFFIGQVIPALTIDDPLKPGKTYFVLPLDIFSSKTLSASSISALVSHTPTRTGRVNFKECPFEYIKGSNGRVLIKVSSEFMERLLTRRGGHDDQENEGSNGEATNGFLCSTPELKKVYQQLVGSKDQTWSPKLETISEHNMIRYSPYRLIGLEGKDKEGGA
ncbi:hypothetical protein HanRHA438_Chr14g0640401 [Helianthus annuus]|uniref:DUF4228 domain protein n=1 Tax=Helianthus annuus TaxID=4232 RepID=A0A251SEF0_HELAN|nr:uncharacterized protein LOC110905434 [Helianthus annuus]KAF5767847.1 hypothetical protein HanXRQr2_Chr14g0629491 [Helianthus annuus]KAJ0467216.1 hypothetical protein HanIR_Chr14g0682871 [Helianthus annuus]KAJ0484671.1 hypothetical protein HanHA89_Chr14g0559461 [Helianthus annuus]KAJ0638614.1 hypothetical protein HanHA300_Chr00c0081g0706001 [Helianthus annuus]KAJ0655223.1 hypothetical protein HanLR1_Chr14g0521751 [Helianthus annuus]